MRDAPASAADRLTVTIDGWFLRGKSRGIGRYIRGLVGALATRHDLDLHVLVPGGPLLVSVADLGHVLTRIRPTPPYPIWEQVVVPLVAARLGSDVLHSPANTFPLR